MQVGVVLDILWPLERIERCARAAEDAGFDQVWLSDHPLGHDPFLAILHLARSMSRIRFGIGTINPSARHPAVIAASAGFLNHLVGGRFSLGIGSSINPLLHPIGLDVKGQVSRCREAVRICRQLLECGHSTLDGNIFQTTDARSRFAGAAPLPILIGASGGPAMLKMSGEVADGVIIPAGNGGFYRYAIERFRSARRSAGHSGPGVVVVNGNLSVDSNADTAVDAIRPLVADAIAHRAENEHSLRHMGISLEQARAWRESPATLPESVVREAAIAGTPTQCVDGLLAFARSGVDQLAMRFPDAAMIRQIGGEVIPALRAAISRRLV